MNYIWRGDAAIAAVTAGRNAAAERIGAAAVGYAKSVCPVRTGRLRASISYSAESGTAAVGSDVEYAACVELGTYRQRAQPYLTPALSQHTQEYAALIRAAMNEGGNT